MYNTRSEEVTVKIPIRIVNGSIKYFYGGELPKIEEGIIGELILPEYAVLDSRFTDISQMEDRVEILPSLSIVMIAVDEREVPDELRDHLIKLSSAWKNSVSKGALYEQFVEVLLQEPLYLQIRGSKKPSLRGVKCYIKSLNKEASSLNNAYPIISTSFEPQRRSHTGNVFQKCFYKYNDNWYPLDVIRDNEVAQFEGKLFLDYKLFELNKDKLKFNIELEESEKLLVEEIKEKDTLTGEEIKRIFNGNKEVYIKDIKDE